MARNRWAVWVIGAAVMAALGGCGVSTSDGPTATSALGTVATTTTPTVPASKTIATATTTTDLQEQVAFEAEVAAAEQAEATVPAAAKLTVGHVTLRSARVDSVVVGDDATIDDQRELLRGVLLYTSVARCTDRVMLLGHRSTGPAPFRNLDRAEIGDVLTAQFDDLTCSWKIAAVDLVTDDEADQRWWQSVGTNSVMMVACACADGSAGCVSHRWFVTAENVAAG
jgi:sortase (surface protein transpeptidase)